MEYLPGFSAPLIGASKLSWEGLWFLGTASALPVPKCKKCSCMQTPSPTPLHGFHTKWGAQGVHGQRHQVLPRGWKLVPREAGAEDPGTSSWWVGQVLGAPVNSSFKCHRPNGS